MSKPSIELLNMDCMDYMDGLPDKAFDLAIVDPPYGIARFGSRVSSIHNRSIDTKINNWDVAPSKEYFIELMRFRHSIHKTMAERKTKSPKIHPTQKPVKLYDWLLKHYAKEGCRILDTHLGSGSSAIAAHYFGCDFVGTGLDPDYYKAAIERFNNETAQEAMF